MLRAAAVFALLCFAAPTLGQEVCTGGQVFNDCGSPCDKTCDEPTPVCAAVCTPRCECPDGQVQISKDDPTCVDIATCSKSECTGGQKFNDCGSPCNKTCDDPTPACIELCMPRCECPDGQVQTSKDDPTCVDIATCPKPTSPPTTTPLIIVDIWCIVGDKPYGVGETIDVCRYCGEDGVIITRPGCVVPPTTVPPDSECPADKIYNECGSACKGTCNDIGKDIFCTAICVAGCECRKGTVLKSETNSTCVPIEECPEPQCEFGQKFNKCGSACTRTCGEPNPICTLACVSRCECPGDLVQRSLTDKTCVEQKECSAIPECFGGQVFMNCGSDCDITCEDPMPMCNKLCRARCQCPEGLVWKRDEEKCVELSTCPVPFLPSCDYMDMLENAHRCFAEAVSMNCRERTMRVLTCMRDKIFSCAVQGNKKNFFVLFEGGEKWFNEIKEELMNLDENNVYVAMVLNYACTPHNNQNYPDFLPLGVTDNFCPTETWDRVAKLLLMALNRYNGVHDGWSRCSMWFELTSEIDSLLENTCDLSWISIPSLRSMIDRIRVQFSRYIHKHVISVQCASSSLTCPETDCGKGCKGANAWMCNYIVWRTQAKIWLTEFKEYLRGCGIGPVHYPEPSYSSDNDDDSEPGSYDDDDTEESYSNSDQGTGSKDDSEPTKSKKETKKDTKETKKDTKDTKKDTKDTKKDTTGTKKDTKDTKKDTKETKKDTKETKKDTKETKKDTTDTKKDTKETKKDTKETKKDTKETKKDTKETKKDTTDTKKDTKETKKDTKDTKKDTKETTKDTKGSKETKGTKTDTKGSKGTKGTNPSTKPSSKDSDEDSIAYTKWSSYDDDDVDLEIPDLDDFVNVRCLHRNKEAYSSDDWNRSMRWCADGKYENWGEISTQWKKEFRIYNVLLKKYQMVKDQCSNDFGFGTDGGCGLMP